MSEEDFRDDFGEDTDHVLDQAAAAIRDAAPMLTMMFAELCRCGLGREAAAEVAVKWWMASTHDAQS